MLRPVYYMIAPLSDLYKQILHHFLIPAILLFFFNVSFGEVVRDTINLVDEENRKQGYWIEYCNGTKIREGNYIDNKKSGIWKNYRKDGSLSYTIQFMNGQPNGEMCSFYANGKLLERGTWVIDHWEGEYYSYHENGNLSGHFFFNQHGNRTGHQKYYHENGQVMISGNWLNGNKDGEVTEFYADGSVKCKKQFCKGKSVPNSIQEYGRGMVREKKSALEKGVAAVFEGNGYHTLYNKLRKPDREGEFKDGKLINGKRYFYNLQGILEKTAIYQNSKVIRWITHSKQ